VSGAPAFGATIMERAAILGRITEREGMLARSYLTPQHREAGELIRGWMRAAGMDADFDALGNVAGRYAGAAPGAATILTGSHMDSVVDAGRYDGVFGILTAIACVADLAKRGKRLPFAIEVVAFGDEEGVRFGTSMMGSKALAGRFDAKALDLPDASGVTLREALRSFGGDPAAIETLRRDRKRIRVFVESHIEQGPVLLDEGLAVGVVTSIAGATRVRVAIQGTEGHAGTVPMTLRHDALAAASEMVLALERHARAGAGKLVGTVGKLAVAGGGAINVIPGRVEFTVDLRSGEDAARRAAVAEVEAQFRAIAKARGVAMEWSPLLELGAAPCDPVEQARLAAAIAAEGLPVRHLPSGAGHDAMQFHGVAPLAMLFVRCGNGGISHSPRETMTAEDADIATRVLLRYLESLA
jgi:allantoate deiminase